MAKEGHDPFTVAAAYLKHKALTEDIANTYQRLTHRRTDLDLQMLFNPKDQVAVDKALGKTVQAMSRLVNVGEEEQEILKIIYEAYASQPDASDKTREILEALAARKTEQTNLMTETKNLLRNMPRKFRPKSIRIRLK